MTAFIGFLTMLGILVGIVLVIVILRWLWEIGLLQALLFLVAIGGGLWFFAINIHRDAVWLGEKVIGAIG